MHITRQQLRELHVGPALYRWFLRRFPQGGSYPAVHAALIADGQSVWLESLVEYAYSHDFGTTPFAQQEITSAQALAAQLTRGATEQLHITPRSSPGRFTPVAACTLQFATGDHALNVGCSGLQSNLASTGNGNFMAQCGDNASIASAGYGCQLISSGFAARVSNSGQNSRLSALGDRARLANCGNAAKISSAGRGTCISNSGRRSYLASSGASTRLVNAGDAVHIHTLGDNARISNSGDGVTLQVSGAGSVICSSGSVQTFTLGEGGCAALAYHDGTRMRFAIFYAGENGVQAGVIYRLSAQGTLEKAGGFKPLSRLNAPLLHRGSTGAVCGFDAGSGTRKAG